jgi:hypothetical protein
LNDFANGMRWERGADYGWSVPYTAVKRGLYMSYLWVMCMCRARCRTHAVSRDNNAMGMRMAHVKKSNHNQRNAPTYNSSSDKFRNAKAERVVGTPWRPDLPYAPSRKVRERYGKATYASKVAPTKP